MEIIQYLKTQEEQIRYYSVAIIFESARIFSYEIVKPLTKFSLVSKDELIEKINQLQKDYKNHQTKYYEMYLVQNYVDFQAFLEKQLQVKINQWSEMFNHEPIYNLDFFLTYLNYEATHFSLYNLEFNLDKFINLLEQPSANELKKTNKDNPLEVCRFIFWNQLEGINDQEQVDKINFDQLSYVKNETLIFIKKEFEEWFYNPLQTFSKNWDEYVKYNLVFFIGNENDFSKNDTQNQIWNKFTANPLNFIKIQQENYEKTKNMVSELLTNFALGFKNEADKLHSRYFLNYTYNQLESLVNRWQEWQDVYIKNYYASNTHPSIYQPNFINNWKEFRILSFIVSSFMDAFKESDRELNLETINFLKTFIEKNDFKNKDDLSSKIENLISKAKQGGHQKYISLVLPKTALSQSILTPLVLDFEKWETTKKIYVILFLDNNKVNLVAFNDIDSLNELEEQIKQSDLKDKLNVSDLVNVSLEGNHTNVLFYKDKNVDQLIKK